MTPTELEAIKVPTLIIQVGNCSLDFMTTELIVNQADKNPLYPLQNAETLQESLVNVPGGAMIFTVKGVAPQLLRLRPFLQRTDLPPQLKLGSSPSSAPQLSTRRSRSFWHGNLGLVATSNGE